MRALVWIPVILALVFVLAAPIDAEEPPKDAKKKDEKKIDEKPVVSDADAKKAIDKFKRRGDTPDLDLRLDEVIALAKVHHPKVALELLRLMKDREVEVQYEAMKGLGRQTCYSRKLERKMTFWLDEKKFKPRVVARTVKTIGRLELRRLEEDVLELVDSPDDDVAVTALNVLGRWKSYKSLRPVMLLWEFYPEERKWAGGPSVTVHTGADKATENRKAKAKWMAKYGGRAKRARPEVVKAIRLNVNRIIGKEKEEEQLKRPAELREWISENKQFLRKYR